MAAGFGLVKLPLEVMEDARQVAAHFIHLLIVFPGKFILVQYQTAFVFVTNVMSAVV